MNFSTDTKVKFHKDAKHGSRRIADNDSLSVPSFHSGVQKLPQGKEPTEEQKLYMEIRKSPLKTKGYYEVFSVNERKKMF